MKALIPTLSLLVAGVALSGCQTTSTSGDVADGSQINVVNQAYDVVYVPVVEFTDGNGRTARDSGAATATLEQCKLVVETMVNRPQPREFQGMMVAETACYEIPRGGKQNKIKLS